MENTRPRNNHQFIVGLKSDMGCKKHPGHKQSPGICSVCLRERLSQISTTSSGDAALSCSSSLSSSCYSSLEGSPVHHKYRTGSTKHATMSGLLRNVREDVFRKSKSLATIERVRKREGEERTERKSKKKGFWSKLLKPRRKKNDTGLVHSDMVNTRVH